MGALLVVGLLAGTWWVLSDARGLGVGPVLFTVLLLCAAGFPLTLSGLRRARASTPSPRPATAPASDLVIDLRDNVVIDLRDHPAVQDLRGLEVARTPTDPQRS